MLARQSKWYRQIIKLSIATALLALVVTGALAASAQPAAAAPRAASYRQYADSGIAALQGWYNPSTGLWNTTNWWNAANALEAVIDYSMRTGSSAYLGVISNTYDRNRAGNFLNDYYDDEGWWALSWIKAYDLTGDVRYLNMAKTIFNDMKGGWDTTCGGGIWWSKARTYKNAIPNELFLTVAIRLHQRTPGDGGAGSYLDWAQREWSWFSASGMINSQNLINDGLTSSCANNGQTTWTYNQGVILGGLVDLYKATGNATYLTRAQSIADAAIARLVTSQGILREPCEPNCGADGPQFKGIFMRNLITLHETQNRQTYQSFITRNADSIWANDRNASNQFGLIWSGPFDTANAANQSSAQDALNAAIPFSSATATPTTGVVFYQDINYGGAASGPKGLGNYASLPADVPDNWMSSLRIPAGWIVDAYANANFGGAVCTFTVSTLWVGSACNDVMSSFRIRTAGPTATPTRTPTPTPRPTATPATGVIFYQDINYGGAASAAIQKGNYAVMPGSVPNDWMSSLRVPAGWTVETYSDGNFGGTRCTFTASTAWVGSTCNDRMSSFRIY